MAVGEGDRGPTSGERDAHARLFEILGRKDKTRVKLKPVENASARLRSRAFSRDQTKKKIKNKTVLKFHFNLRNTNNLNTMFVQ